MSPERPENPGGPADLPEDEAPEGRDPVADWLTSHRVTTTQYERALEEESTAPESALPPGTGAWEPPLEREAPAWLADAVSRGRELVARLVQATAGPVAIGLVVAMAAGAVAPALAVDGLWATRAAGDSPFLVVRVHQMEAALGAGALPPRWMPAGAYGLGYPFWNFYAPLAYLVAAAVALVSGSTVGAIKVTALAAFVGAALGAYVVARRVWRCRSAGLVAAASYTFAPYHMVNLYVRGDALSELVACALAPWVIVGIDSVHARPTTGRMALAAAALAGLLVSHNVSALLIAPVVVAYLAWTGARSVSLAMTAGGGALFSPGLLGRRAPAGDLVPTWRGAPWAVGPGLVRWWLQAAEWVTWRVRPHAVVRGSVAVAAAMVLGSAMAAWFWVPALAEQDAVQLAENTTGYFRFDARDERGGYLHFRGADLVQPSLSVDYAVATGCTPCAMGAVQVLVAGLALAMGLFMAFRRRSPRTVAKPIPGPDRPGLPGPVFWWLVVGATTFMLTEWSVALWEGLPLVEFAQFPWRWLGVQALAVAVVSGGLAARRKRALPIAVLAATGLAAAAMLNVRVAPLAVPQITEAELAIFEVLTTNIGSTVRGEYLPVGVQPRPWSGPAVIAGGPGEPRAEYGLLESAISLSRRPSEQSWRLHVGGTATARIAFPTLWFPGWRADIAPLGQVGSEGVAAASVGRVPGSGWLTVDVPPGEWVVTLALGRTGTRAAAEVVSALALALALALLFVDRRHMLGRQVLAVLVVVALAVVAARFLPVGAVRGPVSMDMVSAPFPHRNPEGIGYGASRLVSASLANTRQVRAGEEVRLQLDWSRPWAGSMVEVALVSPAEPVYGVPDVRALVEATQQTSTSVQLLVPDETPSGLYFLRLRVTNNGRLIEAQTAAGGTITSVYLAPLRITGNPRFRDVPEAPVARMRALVLHAVQTVQASTNPRYLEVRAFWSAEAPSLVNYKTSVRLLDPDGTVVLQEDKEPLYGFYPTTAWRRGEQVLDTRWLSLPDDLPRSTDYQVEIVLYDEFTSEVAGIGRVAGVSIVPPRELAP